MLNKLKVMIFGGMPDKDRRGVAAVSGAPKVGGHISRQRMVIKVTDVISSELWDWFLLKGWRVVDMRNNRRKMVMLPHGAYISIARASLAERENTYQQQIKPFLKAPEK